VEPVVTIWNPRHAAGGDRLVKGATPPIDGVAIDPENVPEVGRRVGLAQQVENQ